MLRRFQTFGKPRDEAFARPPPCAGAASFDASRKTRCASLASPPKTPVPSLTSLATIKSQPLRASFSLARCRARRASPRRSRRRGADGAGAFGDARENVGIFDQRERRRGAPCSFLIFVAAASTRQSATAAAAMKISAGSAPRRRRACRARFRHARSRMPAGSASVDRAR